MLDQAVQLIMTRERCLAVRDLWCNDKKLLLEVAGAAPLLPSPCPVSLGTASVSVDSIKGTFRTCTEKLSLSLQEFVAVEAQIAVYAAVQAFLIIDEVAGASEVFSRALLRLGLHLDQVLRAWLHSQKFLLVYIVEKRLFHGHGELENGALISPCRVGCDLASAEVDNLLADGQVTAIIFIFVAARLVKNRCFEERADLLQLGGWQALAAVGDLDHEFARVVVVGGKDVHGHRAGESERIPE